ncbi:MAG: PIN domain-containing protein [Acidobacteria bacterium]|nr:PIN domain-containing protein [Acidobacteriota bacterium]
MILVDATVLIYAYHPRDERHAACRRWLETTFSGLTPVGLPWLSIWAFLRIGTNPRAFEQPLSMQEARDIVSSWLDVPVVRVLEPGERHWEILSQVVVEARVTGPLVTDAVLAALALEHGASVCTTDKDFLRFPGLTVIDPSKP